MSADRLAEIRARAEAAAVVLSNEVAPPVDWPVRLERSAADVPYLLAEVERLRRGRNIWRDQADRTEAALARVREVAGDLTDAANVELGAGNPHAAALLLAARTDLQNALKGDS